MKSECDDELVEVIDKAIAECKEDYIAALDVVIKFEKKHRGLKGIHVSFDPFAKPCDDEETLMQKRAKEVLMVHRSCAAGEAEDVTDEVMCSGLY